MGKRKKNRPIHVRGGARLGTPTRCGSEKKGPNPSGDSSTLRTVPPNKAGDATCRACVRAA